MVLVIGEKYETLSLYELLLTLPVSTGIKVPAYIFNACPPFLFRRSNCCSFEGLRRSKSGEANGHDNRLRGHAVRSKATDRAAIKGLINRQDLVYLSCWT